MELAVGALGSLLSKLGTLLSDEYKLQKGVRGEIRFLQAEMESMQAALDSVSKLPAHQIDDLNKIWVRELKELVYDIEDSVDAFMVSGDAPLCSKPHSFKRFFDRTIGLLTKAKNRHHIAHDIQDIKRRIQEVTDRRERFKFDATAAKPDTNPIDPRVLATFEHAANLVGTDGPTKKICSLLTQGQGEQEKELMVVSIVGVGGLGKTTIANLVYERLGVQFDCQAFTSVSLKPKMKQIFSSILRQVSKDTCTNAGEKDPEELIRSIRQFLNDKKYLIVIDDVWAESAWTVIKCALIDNNLGSRVIVTTRNADVAKFSCSSIDGTMYELDPLSYEDSKMLLCKRVFNKDEELHFELEEILQKILKKCDGVPLAIITIASLLATRPNKTKYDWYTVYKSMGSGLEKEKTWKNMRDILHLSYCDLPSYLKPCLLYLSMFPEDYEIEKYGLIRLWVAEGFVDEKQGNNLYDHGERYFNELVNRSMIQPLLNKLGTAYACRVHDMILDLIISLSAQENFVTVISEGSQITSPVCKLRRVSLHGSKITSPVCKLLRVSLHGSKLSSNKEQSKEEQVILPATMNMSHVRSLIAFGEVSEWIPPVAMFFVLRVLSLECFPSKSMHAKDLESLHHLRYLKLEGNLETKLLEEIGNLQLLKTLDLREASIEELPASICRLRKLDCLMVGTGVKFPDGIGNLMSLQWLQWLDVKESPSTLAELRNLTKLRTLGIYDLFASERVNEKFLGGLSNLSNLHDLAIFGEDIELICSLDCVPDKWRAPAHLQGFYGYHLTFSRVPWWFSSLSELSTLFISVKLLRQEDLELLGALPALRFLKLEVCDKGTADEELVIGADQPFRSLAKFKFKHFRRSSWMVFSQGVMPKLQRLKLYTPAFKRKGGGYDIGLENLSSLKHITVTVGSPFALSVEVKDVMTMVRAAIRMHPNHPTLVLSRYDVLNKSRRFRYKITNGWKGKPDGCPLFIQPP